MIFTTNLQRKSDSCKLGLLCLTSYQLWKKSKSKSPHLFCIVYISECRTWVWCKPVQFSCWFDSPRVLWITGMRTLIRTRTVTGRTRWRNCRENQSLGDVPPLLHQVIHISFVFLDVLRPQVQLRYDGWIVRRIWPNNCGWDAGLSISRRYGNLVN